MAGDSSGGRSSTRRIWEWGTGVDPPAEHNTNRPEGHEEEERLWSSRVGFRKAVVCGAAILISCACVGWVGQHAAERSVLLGPSGRAAWANAPGIMSAAGPEGLFVGSTDRPAESGWVGTAGDSQMTLGQPSFLEGLAARSKMGLTNRAEGSSDREYESIMARLNTAKQARSSENPANLLVQAKSAVNDLKKQLKDSLARRGRRTRIRDAQRTKSALQKQLMDMSVAAVQHVHARAGASDQLVKVPRGQLQGAVLSENPKPRLSEEEAGAQEEGQISPFSIGIVNALGLHPERKASHDVVGAVDQAVFKGGNHSHDLIGVLNSAVFEPVNKSNTAIDMEAAIAKKLNERIAQAAAANATEMRTPSDHPEFKENDHDPGALIFGRKGVEGVDEHGNVPSHGKFSDKMRAVTEEANKVDTQFGSTDRDVQFARANVMQALGEPSTVTVTVNHGKATTHWSRFGGGSTESESSRDSHGKHSALNLVGSKGSSQLAGGFAGEGDSSDSSGSSCGCGDDLVPCMCKHIGNILTFGKWLLMVLTMVLSVLVCLIIGYMCFGALWAAREFKRQDRAEKLLDQAEAGGQSGGGGGSGGAGGAGGGRGSGGSGSRFTARSGQGSSR